MAQGTFVIHVLIVEGCLIQRTVANIEDIETHSSRRGVLIVDDDTDLRETLSELICCCGVDPIYRAASLAEVASFAPDVLNCSLVLVDVNLGPALPSGIDVWAWLCDHGFGGHIVFMTGHAASHSLVRRACAIEGVGILRKPIDPRVLEELARQDVR